MTDHNYNEFLDGSLLKVVSDTELGSLCFEHYAKCAIELARRYEVLKRNLQNDCSAILPSEVAKELATINDVLNRVNINLQTIVRGGRGAVSFLYAKRFATLASTVKEFDDAYIVYVPKTKPDCSFGPAVDALLEKENA